MDVLLVEIPTVNLGLLTSLSTNKEELEKLQSALMRPLFLLIPTTTVINLRSKEQRTRSRSEKTEPKKNIGNAAIELNCK